MSYFVYGMITKLLRFFYSKQMLFESVDLDLTIQNQVIS